MISYWTPSVCRSQAPLLGHSHCRQRVGLGACGGEAVALLDLEVGGREALLPADLGHRGARRRLGARAHLEPHGAALGETRAELAELLLVPELVEVRHAVEHGEALLEVLEVLAAQPGVDGERRALAARHRVDHGARAGDGVAGGEHALFRRAPGVVVGDQARVGHGQVVGAVAELGRVAGGHDDGRRGELEARAADLLAAALLARDADALDALRLAALGLDLLGQGAELDPDALLEGGGQVAGAGGDVVGLVLGDDDDLLGALAARRARDVEGGDAVADHGDLLRELDGPALAGALEQLEAVQGGVVAREDVRAAPPSCRR